MKVAVIEKINNREKEVKNKNTNKEYNVWFGILRIVLCFSVVIYHFHENEHLIYSHGFMKIIEDSVSYIGGNISVPVFMIMSFYFFVKILEERDKRKFKERLIKLIGTQIFYTLLYVVVYQILCLVTGMPNQYLEINNILYQLFFGNGIGINQTMWYQFDLIVLTIFYFMIFRIHKKDKAIIVTIVLAIISLILQYSRANRNLVSMIPLQTIQPVGRLIEMVPYATIGCILGFYSKKKITVDGVLKLIIAMIPLITVLILEKNSGIKKPAGYGYEGIEPIIIGTSVFMIFNVLPNSIFTNIKVNNIIRFISKYTLGIYCMHRLVGDILFTYFINNINALIAGVLVFILCMIIVFLMSLIPIKFMKKILV